MIKLLYGGRGEGMDAKLLELAANYHAQAKGSVVFIDKDDKHIYDLASGIRLINASDYRIEGPKMFSGFLSGISAQDHDLEKIIICSFMKIVRHPVSSLEGLFDFFEEFSQRIGADMVIGINSDEPIPEYLKKYLA